MRKSQINPEMSWDEIFTIWRDAVGKKIALFGDFRQIVIANPRYPVLADVIPFWRSVEKLDTVTLNYQRSVWNRPGFYPWEPMQELGGVKRTVELLWQYKDDIEKIAALFIAGSIFSRAISSRGRYPERWPAARIASNIYRTALRKLDPIITALPYRDPPHDTVG